MRRIGCDWKDFSACCSVLRAWKLSVDFLERHLGQTD